METMGSLNQARKMSKPMVEKKFETEKDATWARRKDISNGWSVSLIAFDPNRNVYVCDLLY
jgi:hypothetical protein